MKTLKGETYKHRLLLDELRSLSGVRKGCNLLLPFAENGQLNHFICNFEQISAVADYVIEVIYRQYPSLNIPIHSRWRHFEVAGPDRMSLLATKTSGIDRIKSAIELVIVSTLLDAGAGNSWRYVDHLSQTTLSRSEGLAIASYNLFMQGFFSSNLQNAYQADALGLRNISENSLTDGLQVTAKNQLVGVHGRALMLQQLGSIILNRAEYFGNDPVSSRLGNILAYWLSQVKSNKLSIEVIFCSLVDALSEIWPGRYMFDGINLGDVWQHTLLKTDFNQQGFIPFHKLTQWLCYSLIEPLTSLGIEITELELLTGLPEYRNGGLFVDLEVLTPKNSDAFKQVYTLDSELIVEWRAMTVVLLDHLAGVVRNKLQLADHDLTMMQILQGGTWAAGRQIAAKLRSDGAPPFKIESDGTVF